jgi:transposase
MGTQQHYTAAFKQQVLNEYQPNIRGHGFKALAKKYAIPNMSTIHSWYEQWDGTRASLELLPRGGRKRTLTQAEGHALIFKPVHKALKKKQKINYKDIHTQIIAKPEYSHISLYTVQQMGKHNHRLKWKRTEKTLRAEGICKHTHLLFA